MYQFIAKTNNTAQDKNLASTEKNKSKLSFAAMMDGQTQAIANNASPVQMMVEEEEPLQGKAIQRVEEEEPLQGKAIQRVEEEEPLQGKALQRVEEEEPLQGKLIQKQEDEGLQMKQSPVQRKGNNTGLPDNLKAGIEAQSGMDLSHVKVHYNSAKPAEVQAHAFAQGSDIHVAPGQEKHLPHEAWHVVQQMQGRVKPTMQMKGGVSVNDDSGLENEADVMGLKALNK